MYAESHRKVTISGDAFGGRETWSLGFRVRSPGAVSPTDAAQEEAVQTYADLLDPIVTAWWTDTTGWAQFHNTHRLQSIKVAIIMPNGLYPEGHIAGEVLKANVPGPYAVPTSSSYLPQDSICVTLGTVKPRGLASKGRMFLPPTDYAISTDGLLVEAARDAVLTKMKNFITAVNNAEPSGLDVAIFSKGKGVKTFNETTGKIEWDYPTPGPIQTVTQVEVGKVVDTQRRRRRQLVESRESMVLG